MDQRTLGMLLICMGVVAIVAGVLAMTGALGWLGRLPGDIRIESGSTRVYFPIVTHAPALRGAEPGDVDHPPPVVIAEPSS